MNQYIYVVGILFVGFIVYFFVKDYIFVSPVTFTQEQFVAPTSIEIRKAPIYPPRNVAPSGPHSPNQAPENEIIVYGEPIPKDPYNESHESSDIPENLRHPERSFRPPPLHNNSSIAVDAGIANDQSETKFRTEFIQGGGEFMPGIFANDTLSDKSYSDF